MSKSYLFKSGSLYGPFTEAEVEGMKKSGRIHEYAWIIHENDQRWTPIETAPSANPFSAARENKVDGRLSAVILLQGKAHQAEVKAVHEFGIELWFGQQRTLGSRLKPGTEILVNLMDENQGTSVNSKLICRTLSPGNDGTLVQLAWTHGKVFA
jgi:hypothetical protein